MHDLKIANAQEENFWNNYKSFEFYLFTISNVLVSPKLFIWKYQSDVLSRNYSKAEPTEDGISGCRNTSDWKLACDLIHNIII